MEEVSGLRSLGRDETRQQANEPIHNLSKSLRLSITLYQPCLRCRNANLLLHSPVIIIARIIRTILLARATAAILGDRLARSEISQGRLGPCRWA
jgi:hypothetical protein